MEAKLAFSEHSTLNVRYSRFHSHKNSLITDMRSFCTLHCVKWCIFHNKVAFRVHIFKHNREYWGRMMDSIHIQDNSIDRKSTQYQLCCLKISHWTLIVDTPNEPFTGHPYWPFTGMATKWSPMASKWSCVATKWSSMANKWSHFTRASILMYVKSNCLAFRCQLSRPIGPMSRGLRKLALFAVVGLVLVLLMSYLTRMKHRCSWIMHLKHCHKMYLIIG